MHETDQTIENMARAFDLYLEKLLTETDEGVRSRANHVRNGSWENQDPTYRRQVRAGMLAAVDALSHSHLIAERPTASVIHVDDFDVSTLIAAIVGGGHYLVEVKELELARDLLQQTEHNWDRMGPLCKGKVDTVLGYLKRWSGEDGD